MYEYTHIYLHIAIYVVERTDGDIQKNISFLYTKALLPPLQNVYLQIEQLKKN